jgi:polar amino acid transport system substrate-binding protein
VLLWGADEEGGAPFVFRPEQDPDRLVGFEVELMECIARDLGVEAKFEQAQWDQLLPYLDRGGVDVVVNGYEWTALRAQRYLATRPYFAYQFQLIARRDGPVHCWADLRMPKPGGGPWRVAVLMGSASFKTAEDLGGPGVEVVMYSGATDAMNATRYGRVDATFQDLAAAQHYLKLSEFAELTTAGPPEGLGYYVMYLRPDDVGLRNAIDASIGRLIESGELKAIYEKYGIWTPPQQLLGQYQRREATAVVRESHWIDLALVLRYLPSLCRSAGMTILLSVTSFPLAILLGLLIAIGRLYGPRPIAAVLGAYVEVIRGTPLMFQLFVIFYLMPELGLVLPALVAGIAGLAINYSAYEAEIYRAGLQAIPPGQMEAALSLGMSRRMALRRVVVPQAVRIVIPPVTNDFIALFKDTSVCSVITLTELTKQYSILANTYGGVVEFGLAAAVLYMAMSLPLSWFSRWFERRLDAEKSAGGAA